MRQVDGTLNYRQPWLNNGRREKVDETDGARLLPQTNKRLKRFLDDECGQIALVFVQY